MTFENALLYSLLGMCVVFFALIFLLCIIKLMTFIGDRGKPKEEKVQQAPPVEKAVKPAEPIPAPGSAGEVKLYDTPPRIAAMLMAIVADEMKAPINELRFISIKEVRES